MAYSTLKIPEAMACARPVATVPSRQTRELVEDGTSGFLLENGEALWVELLNRLPGAEELAKRGLEAAERAAHRTWEATAARYAELCERLV